MKESNVNIHQIELLEKYYEVDRENKIVIFKMYYDKSSDLLDMRSSLPGNELFNSSVLDEVSEKLNRLPSGYKASVEFIIEDLEGYDPKVLSDRFNDLLELNNYQTSRIRKKKFLITTILVLVGIFILYFGAVLKYKEYLGEGLGVSVLYEIIDISAWVFIWEAVTVLFLSPSELALTNLKLLRNIETISFSNGDGQVRYVKSKENIVESLASESKYANFIRIVFLVVTGAVFVIGGSGLYHAISTLIGITPDAFGENIKIYYLLLIVGLISLFVSILHITIGLTGLFKYMGYKKGFVRLLLPLTIFVWVSLILSFVLMFVVGYFSVFDIIYQVFQFLGISFYIYIIIFFDKITGLKEKKSKSFIGDQDGNK